MAEQKRPQCPGHSTQFTAVCISSSFYDGRIFMKDVRHKKNEIVISCGSKKIDMALQMSPYYPNFYKLSDTVF